VTCGVMGVWNQKVRPWPGTIFDPSSSTFHLIRMALGDNNGRKLQATEVTAWLLLIVLVAVILKELSFIFIPLSIALLLSYALGFPMDVMRSWGVPVYLRIIAGVVFVGSCIYLLSTLIQINVAAFTEQFPDFEQKVIENLNALADWLGVSRAELETILAGLPGGLSGTDLPLLGIAMRWLGGSFVFFLASAFWVLLFMIFILAERESIAHRLERALGGDRSESFRETLGLINREVQRYLGYKILISFSTGVVVALTLWFFNVPFALLWGTAAFILNLAPYVGSIIASIPPVIITLLESGSFGKTLMVAVVITTIQMTIGNLIEPMVMGRRLDLSPLLILFSLVFWGWMWGAIGMLLAIPIMAAIKIAFEQIEATRFLAVLMGSK
jgi:AI-2 transport protein TqsA